MRFLEKSAQKLKIKMSNRSIFIGIVKYVK